MFSNLPFLTRHGNLFNKISLFNLIYPNSFKLEDSFSLLRTLYTREREFYLACLTALRRKAHYPKCDHGIVVHLDMLKGIPAELEKETYALSTVTEPEKETYVT